MEGVYYVRYFFYRSHTRALGYRFIALYTLFVFLLLWLAWLSSRGLGPPAGVPEGRGVYAVPVPVPRLRRECFLSYSSGPSVTFRVPCVSVVGREVTVPPAVPTTFPLIEGTCPARPDGVTDSRPIGRRRVAPLLSYEWTTFPCFFS